MTSASEQTPPPASPASSRQTRWLTAIGIGLLLTWGAWWFASLRQPVPRLVLGTPLGEPGRFTTIPTWSMLGLDFQHNYAGANTWLHGGNPYRAMGNDPMNSRYIYPPLTLGAFAWTGLFPPTSAINLVRPNGAFTFYYPLAAVYVWTACTVAVVALAAWHSWRTRTKAGLSPLPLVLLAAATLISYPAMFELERGNAHALPLVAILGVVAALRWRPSWAADATIAVCVALAFGVKGFPGILVLGLVALRRYRAATMAGGLMALLVVSLWNAFAAWIQVMRDLTAGEAHGYYEYAHSLAMHWRIFWRDLHLPALAVVPATPAVVAAVLGIVGLVSWRVFKSREPARFAWPYLLWLTAMGTFVNKIAIDYGLIFLPLALLTLWDQRDRWWAHAILAGCALWCQPLYLGLSGAALLALKFVSVAAVGLLICLRTANQKEKTV